MARSLNYSSGKYMNQDADITSMDYLNKLAASLSFNQQPNDYLSEESKAKNWNIHQTRMNQSLTDLMKTFSKNSPTKLNQTPNLDITNLDDEQVSGSNTQLDPGSSTSEFKKYLEDLKKNYLEKLTFSCPSKLTTSIGSATANENKRSNDLSENRLKSAENISNLLKKVQPNNASSSTAGSDANVRRSLFDSNEDKLTKSLNMKLNTSSSLKDNDLETPELTKTQILHRLVQIREYLKQAYSMLATLQSSNDLSNYSAQMTKLHSLIDHLKDQENGYMELLQSFTKFQQLTTSLYSDETDKIEISLNNKPGSGSQLNKLQKDILDLSELNESINQQHQELNKQENSMSYLLKSQNEDYSKSAKTNNLSSKKNAADENSINTNESPCNSLTGSFISDTLTLNGGNSNDIVKFKLNTKFKNENFNDIRNDLVIVGKALGKNINNELYEDERTDNDQEVDYDEEDLNATNLDDDKENDGVRQQRQEILSEIDNDLNALEQLREQKKLLRSIRLRKEELKALEGRRKALEALKKLAVDGENQLDEAFVLLNKSKKETDEIEEANQENEQDKNKNLDEFGKYLQFLKEKEAVRSQDEDDNQSLSSLIKNKPVAPLTRKTFKQTGDLTNSHADFMETLISNSTKSSIDTQNQIEKSKQTVREFEDIVRKNISSANHVGIGLLQPIANIDSYENENPIVEANDDLESKKAELAENERKLNELYSMQTRLSQLKGIINHFNELKQAKDEPTNPETNNQPTEDDYRKYLAEHKAFMTEKLNENKLMSQISAASTINEDDQDDGEGEYVDEANKELLDEHKKKLALAKDKLKQLQDLIGRLQNVSSLNDTSTGLTPKKLHEEQQKEARNALKVLNDLENQKKQEKLEELKRNKEKLLELLKEKENESESLAKLYTSYMNKDNHSTSNIDEAENKSKSFYSEKQSEMFNFQRNQSCDSNKSASRSSSVANPCFSSLRASKNEAQSSSAATFGYSNEIENKFESAEGDFDTISIENLNHSPSDLLWTQMKKQLNMRENLRNKKKELEDLIRDVNSSSDNEALKNQTQIQELKEKMLSTFIERSIEKDLDENDKQQQTNEFDIMDECSSSENEKEKAQKSKRNKEEESYEDNNEIINGYRDFFLRKRSNMPGDENNLYSDSNSYEKTYLNKLNKLKSANIDSDSETESETEEEEEETYKPNKSAEAKTSYEKIYLAINSDSKVKLQQENVCSADELINKDIKAIYRDETDENESSESDNDQGEEEEYNDTKPEGELLKIFSTYGKNSNELKYIPSQSEKAESRNASAINELKLDLSKIISNQNKFNEAMQKSFGELLEKVSKQNGQTHEQFSQPPMQPGFFNNNTNSSSYLAMTSQFQFQMQMQVQQLMFNLNSAYHEIANQRKEITDLNEQIKTINSKLNENTKQYTNTSTSPSKYEQVDLVTDPPKDSKPAPPTNHALPSYFYNRKSSPFDEKSHLRVPSNFISRLISNSSSKLEDETAKSNRHEAYYTDDFEELDEDEHEHANNKTLTKEKKPITKVSKSSASSSCSSSSSRLKSSKSSSSSVSSRTNSNFSSDSSNLALRKSPYDNKISNKQSSSLTYKDYLSKRTEKTYSKSYDVNNSDTSSGIYESIQFDKMREKIYSEVATLISKNETRPFYLLNLFRELQFINTKSSRDQVLKSIFNISNRQLPSVDNDFLSYIKNNSSYVSAYNQTNSSSAGYQSEKVNNSNLKSAYNCNSKSQEAYNDDDDVITGGKGKNVSKFGEDYDKKYYNTVEDDETPFESDSLSNTVIFVKSSPKNSITTQTTQSIKSKLSPLKDSSSGSSILGIQETIKQSPTSQDYKEPMQGKDAKINDEVKELISKIIKLIKFADNYADVEDELVDEQEESSWGLKAKKRANLKNNDDDDEGNDSDCLSSSCEYARCDSDYLNEIIDKVMIVLKSSSKHYEYLRLYQNQLTSYLKEALQKYENKRLISVMEDILIDISEILVNELTFYSIMSRKNLFNATNNEKRKDLKLPADFRSSQSSLNSEKFEGSKNETNLNIIKSLSRKKQSKLSDDEAKKEESDYMQSIFKRTSSMSTNQSSTTTDSTNNDDDEPNDLGKVYYFDDSELKSKLDNIESKINRTKNAQMGIELLSKLKTLFKDRFDCDIDYKDILNGDDRDGLKFDDIGLTKPSSSEAQSNGFVIKSIKYLNNNDVPSSFCGDDDDDDDDSEDSDDENVDSTTVEKESSNRESDSEYPYKVIDASSLTLEPDSNDKQEAKDEDDLQDKLTLNEIQISDNQSIINQIDLTPLDKIIMDTISDDLVGNADELPAISTISNPAESLSYKSNNDEENESRSQKSESSNSDNYVIISSSTSSDHEVVEIKKDEIPNENEGGGDVKIDESPSSESKEVENDNNESNSSQSEEQQQKMQ